MRHWKLIVAVLVVLVLLGMGWAANILLWFGPDITPRDYALELRKLQAASGGLSTDDMRAHHQLSLITQKISAVIESGLSEPKYDSLEALSAEEREQVRAWVAALEDVGLYEDFHQLGQIPGYVYPWAGVRLIDNVFTDELPAIRRMTRAGRYRAFEMLESNKTQQAVEIIRDQAKVASLYLSQPVAVHRLTGQAILAHAISTTIHMLRYDLASEEIAELSSIFGQLSIPPMQVVFDGELLMGEEAIASTFQQNVTLKNMSRGALAAKLNSAHAQASVWASKSPNERLADPINLPETRWYESSAEFLIPAYEVLVQSNDQITCRLAGLRVVLAIESYRAGHGSLPTSLSDLVPGHLAEMIPDHYADSAADFGYRIVEDLETYPEGYILYTVGFDGIDDGGVPDSEKPYASLTPDSPGSDFILNVSQ